MNEMRKLMESLDEIENIGSEAHVTEMDDYGPAEEAVQELEDIKESIESALDDAMQVLSNYPEIKAQAESYWYPHILGALSDDHQYTSKSMYTLNDSIGDILRSDNK